MMFKQIYNYKTQDYINTLKHNIETSIHVCVSGDIYFVNLYLSTYPVRTRDPDNCFIDEYWIIKYSIKINYS